MKPGTLKTDIVDYFPGLIGLITHAHADCYHREWGFGAPFETQVAGELAAFVARFRPERDGLWAAVEDGRFLGSVAVDGGLSATEGARLRWFIVVPEARGRGLGRRLIHAALSFCRERRHPIVFLWTFKGLDAARAIYESHGFRLAEEMPSDHWGRGIIEQKFRVETDRLLLTPAPGAGSRAADP